jgi:histidine triad (HIT) family protein
VVPLVKAAAGKVGKPCAFCAIAAGEAPAAVVGEIDDAIAFLDRSPLFLGHVLLVPRVHAETLVDLEPRLVEPLFAFAQRLARAVRDGMGAEGTFVAMNNKVSQSVPHLHVHVVPRTKSDGLKGFFWPRIRYATDEAMEGARSRIAAALAR